VSLTNLYKKYNEKVQFLVIYIREAHPVDGWWLGFRLTRKLVDKYYPKAAMDVNDPKTIEERRAVAGRCETTLQYGIRTYVDEMDDHVNKAYSAQPTRLFLIGKDGRVVYYGGPGPYGFSPTKLGEAIDTYLENETNV